MRKEELISHVLLVLLRKLSCQDKKKKLKNNATATQRLRAQSGRQAVRL